MPGSMSLKRLSTTLAALASAGLLLAGCGGEDSVETSDSILAEYAPASPPLFIEGTVRPEGDLKSDIEELLGRFPQGDQVGGLLLESLNESLAEDNLTYEEDIEPWLGNRAALFIPDASKESAVATVETDDEGAAEEFLRSQLEGETTETQVEDATVVSGTDSDGEPGAFAVVSGIAVLGNNTDDVTEAVRRGQGAAESFSSDTEYSRFAGEAGGNLLVGGRADIEALLQFAKSASDADPAELESARQIFGGLTKEPVLFTVSAESDRATLAFSAAAAETGAGEESELLGAIPQEAWAAVAVPAIGESISGLVEAAGKSGGGTQSQFDQFQSQLRSQLGIDLSDFDSLGDGAFFAAGTSLFEIKVGAAFEVTDDAAATRLLDGARKALSGNPQVAVSPTSLPGAEGFTVRPQGLPVPINFVISGNRLAIAAGDQVTQELLEGEGGFDGSEARDQAVEALGDGFALNAYVDFAPILDLIESTGQGGADVEQARPYLDPLGFIAIGTSRVGERDVSRVVITTSD